MTSLSWGTPEAAISNREVWGHAVDDFFKRPSQVVYSVEPSAFSSTRVRRLYFWRLTVVELNVVPVNQGPDLGIDQEHSSTAPAAVGLEPGSEGGTSDDVAARGQGSTEGGEEGDEPFLRRTGPAIECSFVLVVHVNAVKVILLDPGGKGVRSVGGVSSCR